MVGAGVTTMLTNLEVVVLLIIVMAPFHPMAIRVMALTEIPQGCSSKFLTLGRV